MGFIASQGGSMLSGTYDDLGLSALGFRLQEWAASTSDRHHVRVMPTTDVIVLGAGVSGLAAAARLTAAG